MPSPFNNAIDHISTDLTSPSVPSTSPDSSGTPQSPYNPRSPLSFSPSAVTSPHNPSSTSSPSNATSFPVPSDQNQNPHVSSPELSNQSIDFPTPIPPIRHFPPFLIPYEYINRLMQEVRKGRNKPYSGAMTSFVGGFGVVRRGSTREVVKEDDCGRRLRF
ncbi:unnamed protein product [Vicia faba]|uniref:Uncharacterized protein n=1 Tax=Vicia faba TaxID=3906 RepID=A0AAV0Z043_VICFA|nr:unnamed protein product [Vicia faba]